MPKVLAYTPEWLCRNNSGFQLFNNVQPTPAQAQPRQRGSVQLENGSGSDSDYVGPNKTIARRGAEIFTVVGKQIRWADLSMLKENFEEQKATPSKPSRTTGSRSDIQVEKDGPEDGSYRILTIALGETIRQLSVSPNGDLLAIATAHSVYIALLPDSSHLGRLPNGAIKLKSFAVGPTTHVLSQSQVASILWHPCGVAGNCLVTISVDAVVRLWEFNRDNRWSTDSPTLAVDLKKLVTGSSEEEDFAPGRTRNRAFSLDSVGLEVASACFGGSGSSDESAWSATTLWFAMKGGDVYALCPLLPSKWHPPSTLMPSISTAVVGKLTSAEEESQSNLEEIRQYSDQYEWIRGIDGQDPTIVEGKDEHSPDIEVYSRPTIPGAIPRLQGPFQLFSENVEEDLELSDIHVIAGKIDAEALTSGDDSDSEPDWMDEYGFSAAVVCLMTRGGRVYVCLDVEGVEGQWLPRRKQKMLLPESLKEPYLIVLEGLETLSSSDLLDLEWPTFTNDVQSRYSFFITHSKGVFFFSLDPWVQSLEKELQSSESLGAPFRMDIIRNGPGTLRERMLTFSHEQDLVSDTSVAACLVLEDSDLGYFLLTPINGEPKAAILEEPQPEIVAPLKVEEEEESFKSMPDMDTLSLRGPAREIYQAPQTFSRDSSLLGFFDKHVPSRHRKIMKEQVRMSTATLDLLTSAHRVISKETHLLGIAAADLFRRCERLQEELRDQISRAYEVAHRTEVIVGEDADQYVGNTTSKGHATLDEQLKKVRGKHQELVTRHEKLREKFGKAGEEVSEKEKLWFAEVRKTAESMGLEREEQAQAQDEREDGQESEPETLHRYQEAKDLTTDLVARAKATTEHESHGQTNGNDTHMIPSDLRKERVAKVMKLLERESALVEAATSRLHHLVLSSAA